MNYPHLFPFQYLLFIVLLTCGLSAQQHSSSGTITGHVYNVVTHQIIFSADVMILGSTLGASIDSTGRFVIKNVPPGSYEVRASAIGFAPVIQRGIVVRSDEQTELSFILVEQSIQAEEVVTTGDRDLLFTNQQLSKRSLSYK